MSDRTVDPDGFGAALTGILEDVNGVVRQKAPEAVKEGLKVGQREWKAKAPKKTGKYAKSIRHHMIAKDGERPKGEIGSPTLPGLPHLLEKGHASIGGGRPARAFPHIAPAAEVAFDATEQAMIRLVEEALDG